MFQEKTGQIAAFPPFTVSIISDEMAVRNALAEFLTALKPLDLGGEETGTVELVLAEVLNNVVEHAYPDPAAVGRISITCALKTDGLHLHITDEGEPMPEGVAPVGRQASVDVAFDDLPEGGFGWFLIQDLAKDVTYQRVGAENHLSLRLAVAIKASARPE